MLISQLSHARFMNALTFVFFVLTMSMLHTHSDWILDPQSDILLVSIRSKGALRYFSQICAWATLPENSYCIQHIQQIRGEHNLMTVT